MRHHVSKFRRHYMVGFVLAMFSSLWIATAWNTRPRERAEADSVTSVQIVTTGGEVRHPAIARNGQGDTVLAWQEKTGKDFDIMALRLDKLGHAVGAPFTVNQYLPEDQTSPAVAIDASGNFVVVWQSDGQDASGTGIYGQKFMADGQKTGSEFQANTEIHFNQSGPVVAMNGKGEFAIVWTSENQNGRPKDVYTQRFDVDGRKQGAEFAVAHGLAGTQDTPAAAMDDNGLLMVAFQNTSGPLSTIYAQWIDGSNKALSASAVPIGDPGSALKSRPAVAADNGQFTVAWKEEETVEEAKDIFMHYESILAQRFDAQGKASGKPLSVVSRSRDQEDAPVLAPTRDGTLVLWQEFKGPEDAKVWSVMARSLDAEAASASDTAKVGQFAGSWQTEPVVGGNNEGSIAAWLEADSGKKAQSISLLSF